MENRIKKQQLMLFADRTSTYKMFSNQIRLYFSSLAYVLVQALRQLGLTGTGLSRAQYDTIRLKLFKIGAKIRITVRKFWFSFADGWLSLLENLWSNIGEYSETTYQSVSWEQHVSSPAEEVRPVDGWSTGNWRTTRKRDRVKGILALFACSLGTQGRKFGS